MELFIIGILVSFALFLLAKHTLKQDRHSCSNCSACSQRNFAKCEKNTEESEDEY